MRCDTAAAVSLVPNPPLERPQRQRRQASGKQGQCRQNCTPAYTMQPTSRMRSAVPPSAKTTVAYHCTTVRPSVLVELPSPYFSSECARSQFVPIQVATSDERKLRNRRSCSGREKRKSAADGGRVSTRVQPRRYLSGYVRRLRMMGSTWPIAPRNVVGIAETGQKEGGTGDCADVSGTVDI
jgi:hypothetical protein